MKFTEIPVKQITVGERRRTDLGDIAVLARGIRRVGLLQPIIVDRAGKEQYRLVAGERRLRAIRMLRWETITAALLAELSDAELRDIELEENENRKPLTEGERHKTFRAANQVLENAKKASEIISSTLKEKDPRGRKPKNITSRASQAAALGISEASLIRAEQQVDLAERYPWLQSDDWRQADTLRLGKYLKRIPDSEQGKLLQFMEQASLPFEPRVDQALRYAEIMGLKTADERNEIYQLFGSSDERDHNLALTRAYHRPPMPDVRSRHIHEACLWLKKAIKAPFDREPEAADFISIITQLKELDGRLDARYQELKKTEAQHVEEDIRRKAAIPA